MASVAIVALPNPANPVWKVSSEKKAHMTLLFLGEQEPGPDLARVQEQVEHAAGLMRPFGLTVHHRGTLGDQDADVLFMDTESALFEEIADFRANLLRDQTIWKMWNSIDQFSQWTPHVTLGYPETPANDTEELSGDMIHWIEFDRIALWVDLDEGPEFRLEGRDAFDAIHSAETRKETEMTDVDAFLAHYGVKGMKWGVRRTDEQLERAEAARKSKKSGDSDDEDKGSISDRVKSKVGLKTSSEKEAEEAEKAKDLHISADAERFVKTRMKEGHEMSTREIREALDRARLVQQYDDMFSDGPNADLKAKVEALRLQKEYGEMKAEMNPSKIQKVQSLLDTANKAYSSYKTLDDATGGRLSAKIKSSLSTSTKSSSNPSPGRKRKKGPFRVNPSSVNISATPSGSSLDRG